MLLNEEQTMIRDAVRDFVRGEIAPNAARWDRESTFPAQALAGLASLGCYGIVVPERWGGPGLDYLSLSVVLEEVAAGDGATSTIVAVNSLVCSILLAWGSDEQKERWLRPLAAGRKLGAFCLTEPQAGSDAAALRTVAVRDGSDWVIDGVKQFITSGKTADVAIVFAVTERGAGKRGISAFIVPTDTPGYRVARLEEKAGQHASDTRRSRWSAAGCPTRTASATKARATGSRCPGSKAVASRSLRNR